MGSKRTKKAKQDLELIPNKDTITNGKDEEQIPAENANRTSIENEAPPSAIAIESSQKSSSPTPETLSLGLNETSSLLLSDTTSSSSFPPVMDTSTTALPDSLETSTSETNTTVSSNEASNNQTSSPSTGNIPALKPKAQKRKRKNEGSEVTPKRFKKATSSRPRVRKPKTKQSPVPKVETLDTPQPSTMNGDIKVENYKASTPPKVVTTPPKVVATPPKVVASPPKVVASPPKVAATPAKVLAKIYNAGKLPATSTVRRNSFHLSWPPEDVVQLIDRIERSIPERDILAYKSRVEKINWLGVAFNQYSGEDCKNTWVLIQKRMRRFRLLGEILADAREWLNVPKPQKHSPSKMNSVSKNNSSVRSTIKAPLAAPLQPKRKRHPDTPRRPLSAYLLYYTETKRQIMSSNPSVDKAGLSKLLADMYKALAPEKRETYEKTASANKLEYTQKLKIFYEQHPECKPLPRGAAGQQMLKTEAKTLAKPEPSSPTLSTTLASSTTSEPLNTPSLFTKAGRPKSDRKPGRPVGSPTMPKGEKLPKKFQTPFGLYYEEELKTKEPGVLRLHFREKCKAAYKEMSDEMKVHWITLAEQDLQRYEEELKAFKMRNPNVAIPEGTKHVLSKKEKVTKERVSGKPIRPPNSAYGLFSRDFLTSPEIKAVHPKERMTFIANKWKNSSEEEQNFYKNKLTQLADQYRQDWQTYVATLPEDERKRIAAQSGKEGRKRPKVKAVSPKTGKALGRPVTKVKAARKKPARRRPVRKPSKPAPPKNKLVEPEQPPISAAKYYAQIYKGTEDPAQAWKALSAEEKRKYEEELVKKKQAYIVEFEKYLKSLTKEQLEAFSQSRQQQRSHEEESSCSSGSEGDDDDDDDEADDEDEEKEGENGHNSDTN